MPSIVENPHEMRASADRPVPQPKSNIDVDLLETNFVNALAVLMGVVYSFELARCRRYRPSPDINL